MMQIRELYRIQAALYGCLQNEFVQIPHFENILNYLKLISDSCCLNYIRQYEKEKKDEYDCKRVRGIVNADRREETGSGDTAG